MWNVFQVPRQALTFFSSPLWCFACMPVINNSKNLHMLLTQSCSSLQGWKEILKRRPTGERQPVSSHAKGQIMRFFCPDRGFLRTRRVFLFFKIKKCRVTHQQKGNRIWLVPNCQNFLERDERAGSFYPFFRSPKPNL